MNNIKPSDKENEIYIFSLLIFIWFNKKCIDKCIIESYLEDNEKAFIHFLLENYINGSHGILNNNFLPGDINSLYEKNKLHILEVKSGKDYSGLRDNYSTAANAFGGKRKIFISAITDVSRIINKGKHLFVDKHLEYVKSLNAVISGNIKFTKEIRSTGKKGELEINKLVSKIEDYDHNSAKLSDVKMVVEKYYKFTDMYKEQNYKELRIVNNDNQYKDLDITDFQAQIEKIKDTELLLTPNSNLIKWNNEIDISRKISKIFNKNSDRNIRQALTTTFFTIALFNTPEDFKEVECYESYIDLLYTKYIEPIKNDYEITDFDKDKIFILLKDVFAGGNND